MKIEITTNRLPNKYPQGEVYEVEEPTPALKALLSQGEAKVLTGESTQEKKDRLFAEDEAKNAPVVVEKVEAVVEAKEVSERDTIKSMLTEKGIEFKGNAKTEDLKELLTNS